MPGGRGGRLRSRCVVLILGSSDFQACVGQNETNQSGKASDESLPIFSVAITYRDCFGRFANENNGAITALATVLLTFVTAGLVWVGYRQIITTRAQLRAYIAIENVEASGGKDAYCYC